MNEYPPENSQNIFGYSINKKNLELVGNDMEKKARVLIMVMSLLLSTRTKKAYKMFISMSCFWDESCIRTL